MRTAPGRESVRGARAIGILPIRGSRNKRAHETGQESPPSLRSPALENPRKLALIRIKAVISLEEYAKIMLNRLCGECDE
jgi:hypothetical protein